ncbi:ABC transporter permease [Nonomuraea dietziae]|uniref:ABC transporter permease n=1 Tax=Nonomuraea dietziae TaxID=65515 RepID=UPI00340B6F6F
MRAFTRMSATELTLLSRDPGTLFFMVAFPLMLLVLHTGSERIAVLVPSYLAMILAIGGISALPGFVVTYRERKVLRRLATTPIAPLAVLAAQVVAQLVMGLAGAAIIVVAALAAFGVDAPAHPAPLALAFVLTVLMTCSLGFLIAAVARTVRVADLLGLMIMFPMIFLSGAAIPREGLPPSLRAIGEYLPLGPAVTALREGWAGTPTALPLLALTGIIVVSTVISAALFRWE